MSGNKKQDRKQEFLDTALDLFYEKGYEKTTINDIIGAMDVSKGAFYHYFQSKEDIIETISLDYAQRALKIAKETLKRNDLNAIDKLNTLIKKVQMYKGEQEEKRHRIRKSLRYENLKLEKTIYIKLKDLMLPIYEGIISEGIKDGLFKVNNPIEMTEFMFIMFNGLNSSLREIEGKIDDLDDLEAKQLLNQISEKLIFNEEVLEKILGVNKGTIKIEKPYMERIKKKI